MRWRGYAAGMTLLALISAGCSHSRPQGDATSTGPTASPTSSNVTSSQPSTSVVTTTPTPTTTVTVAGATLALPAGWAAKPTGRNPTWWCLLPASQAVPYLTGDCPIHFIQIPAPPTVQLDVDIPVGLSANPQFCLPVKSNRLVDYGDKTFGGRAADYRRWELSCTTARTFQIEHYVVATRPAYVLFSQNAYARIHSVMSQIASGSTLPAATATLRYADLGYVRSLSHQADGYHITLDRVIDAPGGLINNNPATYAYVVPDVAVPADRTLAINQLARVITDGDRVTQCSGSVTPHG